MSMFDANDLHAGAEATLDVYRRTVANKCDPSITYVDGEALYRDIVMVAGHDPHAYKGVTDFAKPHVRPSGEGGCQGWQKK